ncbi:hypothetical protein EVJ50_10705 [Synechococcus sp. RSCCF101]|uniref:hypothetical protein n=1 Tax=Synechococcus sp. RSCCF101 TaxID=2511069 RepID=UPI001245F022|nr:hypothetical protein [Synechococcus sp. RSCCF101]QEY32621.1 hypothetical protein EVJ50_10705 [Synechococcus sp. RSCCF101]
MPLPLSDPMHAEPSEERDAALWERLGRGRRDPLSRSELTAAYGQTASPSLRQVLAERLGCQGPDAWPLLQELVERFGPEPALVRAMGMTRHPGARDQLLQWWQANESAPGAAELLASLRCWGAQVDPELIAAGLQRAERTARLAALELLQFQVHHHSSDALLDLCAPVLADPRPEVVVAGLRLLQRRSDAAVVETIAQIAADEPVPPVLEAALEALGCIGSEASALALIGLIGRVNDQAGQRALDRQIQSQFRHRERMREALAEARAAGVLDPARAERLLSRPG